MYAGGNLAPSYQVIAAILVVVTSVAGVVDYRGGSGVGHDGALAEDEVPASEEHIVVSAGGGLSEEGPPEAKDEPEVSDQRFVRLLREVVVHRRYVCPIPRPGGKEGKGRS